jgi:hypothetical protein
MDVLLIMNNGQKVDMKILVKLHTKPLKEQVKYLMQEGREKDAFDLIVKRAEVKSYIPHGQKARIRPQLTLIEDLL